MKEGGKTRIFVFLGIVIFLLSFFTYEALAVQPFGAIVNATNVSTAPADLPTSIPAQAGNVTELNVFGYSTTQSWQGYYGNVSGTIQLADGNDNVMYNWSLASPKGEIYASTNDTIQWGNVQCFNYTATGEYEDDTLQAGATSLYGKNLTQLETEFGINTTEAADGVDETFNLIGPGTHDVFYTANQLFSEGECRNTRIFDNTGQGVSDKFEEVLLYEPSTTSVIFTSVLDRDAVGFNGRTNDFQMLVLEDGHGSDVSSTPYYFFVELQ